jgi:ribA/ribD-fused uncharacterized protein
MLESFVKPQQEYLVPFKKITELFAKRGFDLIESDLFRDIYPHQTKFAFGDAEQEFSFLNRTFVFRRVRAKEAEAVVEKAKTETETETETEVKANANAKEEPKEEEAETKAEDIKETIEVKEEQGVEEDEITKKIKAAVEQAMSNVVRRKKKLAPTPTAPAMSSAAAAEPSTEPASTELPVFFFSKLPENKEFSNFYEAKFTLDGNEYPTAEHAYQAIKAKTFGDEAMFDKIMKAKSAQSAKAFGRKVANFKEETWSAKKNDVMTSILRAKFTQNPDIRAKLLETGTRPIANADPRNKYWGIGTSLNTEKAKDPSKWLGANTLGKLLVDLRESFRAEE